MDTSVTPGATRRGRRYRPPADTSPYADPTGGGAIRLAWLMGNHRLTARSGAFEHRGSFLPALEAASPGLSLDESGVSRWESGARPPGLAAMRAYEEALALPGGTLRAAAHLLGCEPNGLPTLRAASSHESRLAALIDLALDGSPTGADWLDLAEELLAHGPVFMRAGVADEPCDRLVTEAGRATGAEYATRRAALQLFLAHPSLSSHLVAAVERYVAAPGAPRRADAAALLQHAPTTVATTASIGLARSVDAPTRRGGLRAIAALLAHDRFDPSHLVSVRAIVDAELSADDDAIHAADVVTRLPEQVANALRQRFAGHPALELVARTGELVPARTASEIAQIIAGDARGTHRLRVADRDATLERLIREALFHAHAERRAGARTLLGLSPFREGVATALRSHLRDARADVAHRMAAVLDAACHLEDSPLPGGSTFLS